tara:strand:- start:1986 stop:3356 length:1371 start_codon:yes stop_codon:yes gene_type:complete
MVISSKKINFEAFLINSLFSFIPISFIAGNLVLNINILLFIICASYFRGKDIFKINLHTIDKLIIIFFAYVFIVGLLNNFFFKDAEIFPNNIIIVKTIFYLRFLLFYFAIRIMVEKNIINFKTFLIFCSLCSYFVCFDLIYQFNFGKDIFGFTSNDPRRLGGPFGDELIAGSYLQRFAIFAFFSILIFFNIKNKLYLSLIIFLTFALFFISLIISGNRIPLILFLILVLLVFSAYKTIRKYLLPLILSIAIIFGISFNINPNIKDHFVHFNNKVIESINFFSTIIIKDKKSKIVDLGNVEGQYEITVNGKLIQIPNNYIKELNSGYQTWLKNKYIGGGIKSFHKNCQVSGKSFNILNCSSHPHNYYLEILSEIGIIGLILLIVIILKIFINNLINKNMFSYSLEKHDIIIPFIFLFLLEVFPIRTTGSFFTTGNATYIFLVMAITIALSPSNDKKT